MRVYSKWISIAGNPDTVMVGSGLSLTLTNSGSSVFEITNPAYSAGTYDLVNGNGSVVFDGVLNLAFTGGTYANGADVLQLFANTGGRSGNFLVVTFTGLDVGQSATFNPVTDYVSIVPEPLHLRLGPRRPGLRRVLHVAAAEAGLIRTSECDSNMRGAGRHHGPAPLCVFTAARTAGGSGLENPLAGDGFQAIGSPISHRGDEGAVRHEEPESGGENPG